MLKHRKIGDADFYLVCEFSGPTHERQWMLPDSTWEQMEEQKPLLENRFWMPKTDRLIFTMSLAVICIGRRVIVVDTGVGNHKHRKPGWQAMHNTPTLDWLNGIGASRERVTDVVLTHLHGDHIGWNTIDEGHGWWEPTFPNAVYHFPDADFAAYKSRFEKDDTLFDGGFADSILPIVQAGLTQFYKPGDEIADTLLAFDGAGHSPGQCGLELSHGGETLLFTADIFHSPIQVRHPVINSRWCELPDRARDTRRTVLERAASTGARLLPAHSYTINGWQISATATGFDVQIED